MYSHLLQYINLIRSQATTKIMKISNCSNFVFCQDTFSPKSYQQLLLQNSNTILSAIIHPHPQKASQQFHNDELIDKDSSWISKQLKNHHGLTDQILTQHNVKQSSQTSTNIPKFLLKLIEKYFEEDSESILGPVSFNIKIKRFFRRNKSYNLTIIHRFLNKQLINGYNPSVNRKIMWNIIRQKIKAQMIENKKIRKKQLYVNSAKIYRLRCRSSQLITRNKIC